MGGRFSNAATSPSRNVGRHAAHTFELLKGNPGNENI
jgi:hypothetical protein